MKADILRRAEAILEQEDEDGNSPDQPNERVVFSPEDELEEAEALKINVIGDGEENDEGDPEELDDDDDEEEEEEEESQSTPETILELAWLRDVKLFDRDAATRRSQSRMQLRKDTGELSSLPVIKFYPTTIFFQGWVDEQIEGWKVMLDRNVSRPIDSTYPLDDPCVLFFCSSRKCKKRSGKNTSSVEISLYYLS